MIARRLRLLVTVTAATALMSGALCASQGLTGVQASWRDLETWSHYLPDTKENELGLGLQPSGSLIAFLGRLSVAAPRTPPVQIRVQVAAGVLASPNLIRRSTLTLVADAGTETRRSFDLSGRMIVDDPMPGGNIQNGVATMSAADFVRLGQSKTLKGDIFGFEIVFTREQIAAMKAFANTLHLTSAPR